MAVESSEGRGADSSAEFLSPAEFELKKEREMGGDFEHIACRGGEDYDSNETEGSFVMVKCGADSDARSDSSEREIELDVGGVAGDQPVAVGGRPSADNERVDDWKIDGKDGDSSSSEIEEKPAEMGEEVAVDSTRSDLELKEADDVGGEVLKNVASADSWDERETAIEDLDGEGGVMDRDAAKNEEQNRLEEGSMVVEDSKGEDGEVSGDLNDEKEGVTCMEKGVSDGMVAGFVNNDAGTSADAVNTDHELESVFEESKIVESSVTQPLDDEVEADYGIEEGKKANDERIGDDEFSVEGKKKVDSVPEIQQRSASADEVAKNSMASVAQPGKKEVNYTSDLEEERKIDDEKNEIVVFSTTELLDKGFDYNAMIESEDTKDEGNKDAESSITDYEEQVGSHSPDGVRKTANENITNCSNVENESKSAIQVNENQQIKAPEIESNSVHGDLMSSADHVQQKEAGASPPNPSSEVKENSFESTGSSSISEAFFNINQQNEDSPTDSTCVDRDLRSSGEQIQRQDVNTALSKSDNEEKEQDSSIELIYEPVKERVGSHVFEQYQIAEGSSNYQVLESVDQDVDLASPAEDGHVETLSIENQQSKTSPNDSDRVSKEFTQDVNASLSKSDSEEKENDSSLDLTAESVKEVICRSSIDKQYIVAETSSPGQNSVSVSECASLVSLAEDKSKVMSITNQQLKSSPTESEQLTQDVDASLSVDIEEKGHDLSNESFIEPAKDNIVSSSIFEDSEVSPNDQMPESVNDDSYLASQTEDKNAKPLFIENQQSKVSPTDSGGVDPSLLQSDGEEKEHGSSSELIVEPAKNNIDSLSIAEYHAREAESHDSVNDHNSLDSRSEDQLIEALSIHNQQCKSSQRDSESVDRAFSSSVVKVQLQEHESSTELIAEPSKDNSGSSSLVEEYPVEKALSFGQSQDSFNKDAKLVSQVEDEHSEAFSVENQQINALPTCSVSVDRDLRSSVEHVQQEDANVSLSESSHQEKEPDACIELTTEPVKENSSLSSILDKNKVVEDSPPAQSSESVEDVNFASHAEDRHFANLSTDGNLVPFKEELVSPTKTEEDKNEENKNEENKNEENNDSEALTTKGVNERIKLHLGTVVSSLEAQTVEHVKGVENQLIGSVKEHGSEDIEAEGQKDDVKSATAVEELQNFQPDKDLGVLKEQQEELKTEKKQAAEHIEQYQGSSAPLLSDGAVEKVEKIVKKFYIIKIPRFTQRVIDNELQQKIHEAQMKVDEKTRSRDAIMAELEDMRKVLSDCCRKRDFAIEEEKKSRTLVNAKRQEMDSLQSVISKGNTAAIFLDIASQIQTLSHKIQHETVSLKEEKKLIYELKQLEHEQEHHVFNKCSQQEIDEILRQKETAESRLKALKKEFDLLRSTHLKADEFAKTASKNYINQFNKVKEHEKKWRAANELRQNAYKDFHGLKSDKMDHFWKYMDDRQAARKYTSSRDIDALDRHCTGQIERILQLWNEDRDFRKQYIESNVNSTLRRFGTLDGRTIGLNEEAVALPSRVPPPSSTRSLAAPVNVHKEQLGSAPEISRRELQAKKTVRSKPSSNSTSIRNTPIVSVREEIVEEAKVERNLEEEAQIRLQEEQRRKEEEQKRKEEELVKERESMELKEKIRMEQRAKAKEAEERKRRKSEKALARAEYKAQKVAELREQKRAKKEKKKEELPESTGSTEGENASVTEFSSYDTSPEPERILKKSTRQSTAASNKYNNRVQPVPFPLRNKGKRKSSMLVWTLCGAVAVGGLIFAGNYVSLAKINLLDFGF